MNRKEFDDTRNWHSRGFIPHYDAGAKYQMITYRLADSLPNEVLRQLGAPHSNADESTRTKLGAPHSNADEKRREIELKRLGAPHSNADVNAKQRNYCVSKLGAPHSNADEDTKKRKLTESLLDQSYGSCLLQNPKVAKTQIEAWQYFHHKRYELIAYVVMPNHVHILIKTYNEWPISKLVASWKKHVTYFIQKDKELWEEYCKSYLLYRRGLTNGKSSLVANEFELESSALECGPLSSKIYLWQKEYWDRFIRDENHFQNSVRYIMENPMKAGLVDSIETWPWSAVL